MPGLPDRFEVILTLNLDDGMKVAQRQAVDTLSDARRLAGEWLLHPDYRGLGDDRLGVTIYQPTEIG